MKRTALAALCLAAVLLSLAPAARADSLSLPEGLTELETEAFAGDTSLTEVVLPDTVTAIGDQAFADCAALGWATVPGSAETIGEGAFDGCAADLLIRTEPESAACLYARANDVDYQADTVYRALLIGQSYPGSTLVETLEGPPNDVAALEACLEGFPNTPWQVTVESNLTADGILAALDDAFYGATASDVSLFYYSGHGLTSSTSGMTGALVGVDAFNCVTAAQLRAATDRIPGRKIIMIDACYSGNFMPENLRAGVSSRGYRGGIELTHVDFAASFIRAFSRTSRAAGAAGEAYFIMTAAAADELSYEYCYTVGGVDRTVGLFTSTVCEGCGYDEVRQRACALKADVNANGVITFDEIYRYVYNQTIGEDQSVQVWPAGCAWFGPMRR